MAGKLYFALVAVDGDKVVGMITAALCDEDDAQVVSTARSFLPTSNFRIGVSWLDDSVPLGELRD